MSLTYWEAVEEMNTMLYDAWSTTGYEMTWEAVGEDREETSDPWATAAIRHADALQDTLGGVGNRSFRRVGVIIVQIFTPTGNGLQESYDLAKVVIDAFEGKASPGGVWFRNVRLNEIGHEGHFMQTNVLVDFRYDERK